MLPILPREMLWTDKVRMEEFFDLDPINLDFYEEFMRLQNSPEAARMEDLKIFNEVYYQVTRIVFERPLPAQLITYVTDIKANIGWYSGAEMVMSMAYFLIVLMDKHERPLNKFFTRAIYQRFGRCVFWKPFKHCFERLKKEKRQLTYHFNPHPQDVVDLSSFYIDWRTITQNYDTSAVINVLNLWEDKGDRRLVLRLIRESLDDRPGMAAQKREFEKMQSGVLKAISGQEETEKAEGGKYEYEVDFGSGSMLCSEPNSYMEANELRKTIEQLTQEKRVLKDKILEQEAEISRMNALLAPENNQGKNRKFTLVEIVNYCKDCVDWRNVESIVAMLNRLLRYIATKEDGELVDSIETEFRSRTYGKTHTELVLQKYVENEIQKVEAGGTGINNEIKKD